MPIRRSMRRGFPAVTALLAALVMLVQGLAPAFAAAGPPTTMLVQLCTHDGVKTVAVPVDPGQVPAGALPDCCKHCVMTPGLAADAAAPLNMARYAVTHRIGAGPSVTPSIRARAPPRPPSQAPPLNA